MNNDELEKKIVEIMSKVWEESVPCTAERKFECISDAFIAAGVGDVKETEHRAEVAERALELMARGECTFAYPEYYKEQAELELAKEGKNNG